MAAAGALSFLATALRLSCRSCGFSRCPASGYVMLACVNALHGTTLHLHPACICTQQQSAGMRNQHSAPCNAISNCPCTPAVAAPRRWSSCWPACSQMPQWLSPRWASASTSMHGCICCRWGLVRQSTQAYPMLWGQVRPWLELGLLLV